MFGRKSDTRALAFAVKALKELQERKEIEGRAAGFSFQPPSP
jgi:hypothetical protein